MLPSKLVESDCLAHHAVSGILRETLNVPPSPRTGRRTHIRGNNADRAPVTTGRNRLPVSAAGNRPKPALHPPAADAGSQAMLQALVKRSRTHHRGIAPAELHF